MLDYAALLAERGDVERQGGAAPSRILRRPSGYQDHHGRPSGHDVKAPQTMKEREEDYNRARERIIGGAETTSGDASVPLHTASSVGSGSAGGSVGGTPYSQGGRGGGGGGGYASRGNGSRDGSGSGGRGRGRKAVFRDKDREMQDPDYARRDGPNMYMDPSGYGMEVRQSLLDHVSFCHPIPVLVYCHIAGL